MLEEVQLWWQNLTPETHAAIQTVGFVLVVLLGGYVLGGMVARALRGRNFDAVLRLPGSSLPEGEADRSFTPTFIAGWLVRLTVWAGAGWWLAHKFGRVELADTLVLILGRTWTFIGLLVAVLVLGSLLARRVMDCLHASSKGGLDTLNGRNGTAHSHGYAAGAVGAGSYLLVVLLVLLIAADLFDWPQTRASVLALWQFAQHLLIAGAALLIGWLGARWARDLGTSEGAVSPEKRASQYTALGIMAATTVLAVAVLLSSAGLLLGLAALAILGFLLWLARGYLPDIAAGLQLRSHKVREVWFDGVAWQVAEIGFVTTQLGRSGEFCRVQNRYVLEARLHEAPKEANPIEEPVRRGNW